MPNNFFFKFFKHCVSGGALAALSFLCFAALFHFGSPEAERFSDALRQNAVGSWVHWNLGNLKSAWLTLLFLVLSALMATIGFVAGTLGTCYVEKAVEVAKKGIIENGSDPISLP